MRIGETRTGRGELEQGNWGNWNRKERGMRGEWEQSNWGMLMGNYINRL